MPRGKKTVKKVEEGSESAKYVNLEQFNQLVDVIGNLAKSIDEMKKPEIIGAESEKIKDVPINEDDGSGMIDKLPIPPGWRRLVDEILGPEFGIDVSYPDNNGSGFKFTIIVPDEKSNMSEPYRKMYRVDKRTKALSNSEGIDGVRKYCELVAQNLGIKKK
jgi:hypothetical protein